MTVGRAKAALLGAMLLGTGPAGGAASSLPARPLGAAAGPWVRVEYGSLVERRLLSHSGEPVGVLLDRLGGRPFPAAGERPDDALAWRLLDPLQEPYAFVLEDALDALAAPHEPPYVEVGALWEPGEEQPAWAELCRARELVLQSDGAGHLRAILPAAALGALPYDDALPELDPAKTAEAAWREAWPVLRHALAAERRRLAREAGGAPPPLEVEVHAYRPLMSREAFVLGTAPWRTQVDDTSGDGSRPLSLRALERALSGGLEIEGARLEPDGKVRWLLSEPDAPPHILGRPPTLADAAVAYRAVAHGGLGEPYMSLDRGAGPQVADVNYGGRLRDTALGKVSLLCDARFKTFSVGVDLLGAGDVRASVRSALPGFLTHLERFARDPAGGAAPDQQTRFWFYPDDVDLTVSPAFDLLAIRTARMTAASERVQAAGAARNDPAWTRATVGFLNAEHARMAEVFPEIGELDTVARLLAAFTWLTAAKARGLPVPDLDVLMGVTLPAVPTPRRFPELLTDDVLPPPGGTAGVEVYERAAVVDALDRLAPRDGRSPSPVRRFSRALALLDPAVPDQAALAAEMRRSSTSADPETLDLLAYRAERLFMHGLGLQTLPAEERASEEARRKADAGTRVVSVGIGGIDLGMGGALARASRGSSPLSIGRAPAAASARSSPELQAAPRAGAADRDPVVPEPETLPPVELPDHGLGPAAARTVIELPEGRGRVELLGRPGSEVARGAFEAGEGKTIAWDEVRLDDEGPELRAWRRVGAPDGGPPVFERVERGRFLSYRFDRSGSTMRTVTAVPALPHDVLDAASRRPPAPASAALPPGLAALDVVPPPPGDATALGDRPDPPAVRLRLRDGTGRDVSASVPRGLLIRLVLGREVDRAPDRPLAGFTPPERLLGSARTLMVMMAADEARPPWGGPTDQRTGEEDPWALAPAFDAWWGGDPATGWAHAVVGTDPVASPTRWAAAALDGPVAPLVPGDVPPAAKALILVSADSPGVLGKRLRALARDPAMSGKILAVASLGGPVRGDLPAGLLREGRLAALGIYEAGPVGLDRARGRAEAWARSGSLATGQKPEQVPGPFTWFY